MKKCFGTHAARFLALLFGLAVFSLTSQAGEVNVTKDGAAKTEEEPTQYSNWITLGIGGVTTDGDDAQFQQRHWLNSGVFGGIEDLHWEPQLSNKNVTLTLDGRALGGIEDYRGKIVLTYKDVGYINAGVNRYRTFYDGNAGFFPGNDLFFDLYDNDFSIDRTNAWIELGLRVPNLPEITFRYEFIDRNGQKDSTEWADTSLTGLPPPNNVRNIVPTFLDIDEKRHVFTLELKHTISITDISVGARYEVQENDDSRNIHRRPGEDADRFLTQREKIDADLFSVHIFSETRWNNKIHFNMAYMFTTLDSNIGGSRIYGASYDPIFDPIYDRRQQRDEGFIDIVGGSRLNQHVANLNLWWSPWKNFVVIPAIRYEHNDLDGTSQYGETNVLAGPSAVVVEPIQSQSQRWFENVTETLEFRYTGLKNWAFYARGEWLEEDLNQQENEFERETGDILLLRDTDGNIFTQKYIAGATWYPRPGLTFAGQYYRKIHENDYVHPVDSTDNMIGEGDRYPAFLRDQNFNTDDVNFRVTWRPMSNFTSVTRYDFQKATVDTRGDFLQEVQSSDITVHIFSESITWNPIEQLYLQAAVHYVQSTTDTPADQQLPGVILDGENDYWNGTFSAGYAFDDKTDLQLTYFYYRADNFQDNSSGGQPYGAGAEEHAVTATLTRAITKNIRATLKYGYFSNCDETSGGHNNYHAHLIATSLQYQF